MIKYAAALPAPKTRSSQSKRKLAVIAVMAGVGLTLSACDMMAETPEPTEAEQAEREAIITSSFRVSSALGDLTFLPSSDAPWTGLLATTLSGGGFDIFSIEGERLVSASGPRLNGLSGISAFALRGETFPILFGADLDNQLRSFVVLSEVGDIVELPLEFAANSDTSSVCLYGSGIGFIDLALLGVDAEASIVRIRDAGGAGLDVETRAQFALPYPARDCAVAQGDLVIAGPTAGIARVTTDGDLLAETRGLSIFDVTYTELFGQPAILATEPGTNALVVYDAETLQTLATLETTGGLSTEGFQRPTALASTLDSYGGMAFANGLVAGYDREDATVKLVARDVISRAVFSPSDTTG